MTRRLVLLEDEEPGEEGYDRLNRLRDVIPVRCDACKHWDATGDSAVDYDEDCKEVTFPHKRCERVVFLYDERYDRLDTTRAAYVMDASGYHATLWTRPEYGCAAFEVKS